MLNDRENILSALREKPLKVYEVMKRANVVKGLVKFDIHKGRWLIRSFSNCGAADPTAAMTRAPNKWAISTQARPTPPAAPVTSTISPAYNLARSTNAYQAVR